MVRKAAGEMVVTLETEILATNIIAWETWLCEGPAKGLSRQHKMSRTRTGWIPIAKFEYSEFPEDPEVDDSEANLSWDACPAARTQTTADGVPGSVNQEITNEVAAWQREWACHEDSGPMLPVIWPDDLGAPPERMDIERLRKALLSFPVQLGLGWDKTHPRAIARLDDTILEAI